MTKMKGFVVESLNQKGEHLIGSDAVMLAHDLRSLTWCRKRAMKFPWNPKAYTLVFYEQKYEDRYKQGTAKELFRINKSMV